MAYNTPGVYVEEPQSLPPSVAGVATAVPAFIGYTQVAKQFVDDDLHLKPKRINSWPDYQAYFGSADPETSITVAIAAGTDGVLRATPDLSEAKRSRYLMYYALQLYFANGGGPCYIVSVGKYAAAPAHTAADLDPALLTDGLHAIEKEDEPTLIVFPEAQNLAIDKYLTLHQLALQQCAALQDRFVIMDLHGGAVSLSTPNVPLGTQITDALTNFRGPPNIGTDNLKYGAVYAPNIETTLVFVYDPSSTMVTVRGGAPTAMTALDNQSNQMAKAAITNLSCKMPPAAAMAGIYAAVDSSRGVWKAPANVSIVTAIQPTLPITNTDQDGMNVDPTAGMSVNAIRAFTGLGTLVWGARTLAGNDNEWRYINVRRFCIYAEESIRKATQQFVFEPNDANTWVKVQGMIENFLTTLWRAGALMGSKVADAFSVSVGLGKTMTAVDVLEGRMIVVIGLCPVRPAEFIILRLVQTMPVS
jgi:phage tail sheath protein FI